MLGWAPVGFLPVGIFPPFPAHASSAGPSGRRLRPAELRALEARARAARQQAELEARQEAQEAREHLEGLRRIAAGLSPHEPPPAALEPIFDDIPPEVIALLLLY